MPERKERFPEAEHLRGRNSFRRVYEQGQATHGRYLIMILLHEPELTRAVGFVSSRKVGNAVRRNRARRLLRESWRRLRDGINEKGDRCHFVIVARHALPDAPFEEIASELRSMMLTAGVLDGTRVDRHGG